MGKITVLIVDTTPLSGKPGRSCSAGMKTLRLLLK